MDLQVQQAWAVQVPAPELEGAIMGVGHCSLEERDHLAVAADEHFLLERQRMDQGEVFLVRNRLGDAEDRRQEDRTHWGAVAREVQRHREDLVAAVAGRVGDRRGQDPDVGLVEEQGHPVDAAAEG